MATKPGGTGTSGAQQAAGMPFRSSRAPVPALPRLPPRHQRWLSREAPQLPLPGCTRPDTCRCTYQHHEDRRAGGRRAEDTDAFRQPAVANRAERRSRRDRRKQSDE